MVRFQFTYQFTHTYSIRSMFSVARSLPAVFIIAPVVYYLDVMHKTSRSLCLSLLARTLGSWVRIPLKAWMFVCVCSVFVLFCV
jgi:hypothetical protein